jgi:hypothetical protein
VRWERLFEDLEAQLDAARAQEARVGLVELVRAERASTHLVDRLRASVGLSLCVRVGNLAGEQDATVSGDLLDVGSDWLLIAEREAARALVPLAGVQAVGGLAPYIAPPDGSVAARLGLPHALRALARDRAQVAVWTPAHTLVGRLDRVGSDHVDVTPAAGPPWTVPIAALRVVRSR